MGNCYCCDKRDYKNILKKKENEMTTKIGSALSVIITVGIFICTSACAYAQQSDGTVSIKLEQPMVLYRATSCDYSCLEYYLGIDDALMQGDLHIVVRSHRDEHGCMAYTVDHNWTTVLVKGQQSIDWDFKGSAYSTTAQTAAYCDEEACEINVALQGTFELTGIQGTNCKVDHEVQYTIEYTWNRCTGEWTLVSWYGRIECP